MRLGPVLAFSLFLAAVAGCRENRDRAPSTSPTIGSSPMRPLGPAVMIRHESLSIAIREAIVRGDLPSTRRNAVELGAVTVGGSPELLERSKDLTNAANVIAHAEDLPTAARAMGGLVQTCADCHARLTGPTQLEVTKPMPSAGPRNMPRHNWAMNRLWDGIVTNSEVPWHAGAEALVDETLPGMTALGRRAAAASETSVRAEIYGELLATCADCHRQIR